MISKLLKSLYEEFWVPTFGRLLLLFSTLIEGEKPDNLNNHTFDLRDSSQKDDLQKPQK